MPDRTHPFAAAASQRGVTLIELAVALGLLAVLLGLALPGMQTLRANAALTSAANQMLLALHLARGAALTRGATTVLCQSDDLESCRGGDGGSAGYIVFVNGESGGPTRRDAGEEILRRYQLPQGLVLTGSRGFALYHPWPRAGTTVTWRFCDGSGTAPARRVIVSQTGRPRVEREGAPAPCVR
ncbi:MAG: GspH/FimT family protein [Pseudomonadota bacterium]